MRVLQLIKTTRGASWALRQVAALRNLGHDVHVALPNYEGLASAYRDAGVQVHVMETDIARMKSLQRFFTARAAFRSLVNQIRPDVIHSHFVGTTLFMRFALGRSGPPRAFQVPGPLHLENPITRAVDIRSASARDSWIASCRFTRSVYLAHGVNPARVGLAYYGLNLAEFRSDRIVDFRREFGLPDSTSIIGMVAFIYAPKRYLGQTRGLKGHEDLIDAVELLLTSGRDCAAIFVGGAWTGAEAYEHKVRTYARERLGDRAIFLGNRSDVANLYTGFDVAVHPSHSENLGGAVESLALAIPTVATCVGGFPDVVQPGETGWLVRPRDPQDLARALADALDDTHRARRYAEAGSRRVRRMLDVETNAREVADHYETLVGTGTRQ